MEHMIYKEFRALLDDGAGHRLNIVVIGATGSGKTTVSEALIKENSADERIISIEDAGELESTKPNVVRVLYSRRGFQTCSAIIRERG